MTRVLRNMRVNNAGGNCLQVVAGINCLPCCDVFRWHRDERDEARETADCFHENCGDVVAVLVLSEHCHEP